MPSQRAVPDDPPVRALVVDDDPVTRMSVELTLQDLGYEVVAAATGAAGVTEALSQELDVILLDINLPDRSGLSVLQSLLAEPSLADVSVIFLTGRADPSEVAAGIDAGAHDYLRKPFEPVELQARVRAAVRTTRLRRRLSLQARTDELTGLPNRRAVERELDIVTSSAARLELPAAAILMDVDHFKLVNDTHGHLAGDAVLRAVSARLSGAMRREDMLGRWGGEEFLAVLLGASLAHAAVAAERLRLAVCSTPVLLPGGASVDVSVSLGVASGVHIDPEELVHLADGALLHAKETGRNRTVTTDQLLVRD